MLQPDDASIAKSFVSGSVASGYSTKSNSIFIGICVPDAGKLFLSKNLVLTVITISSLSPCSMKYKKSPSTTASCCQGYVRWYEIAH